MREQRTEALERVGAPSMAAQNVFLVITADPGPLTPPECDGFRRAIATDLDRIGPVWLAERLEGMAGVDLDKLHAAVAMLFTAHWGVDKDRRDTAVAAVVAACSAAPVSRESGSQGNESQTKPTNQGES